MKYFTQEELKPSEMTLSIIRQIAYACNAKKSNSCNGSYCLS